MSNRITNFFITGSKNTGKSYLIRNIIHSMDLACGGFLTLPIYEHGSRKGFYFHSMVTTSADNDQFIAYDDGNGLAVCENTYITLGSECLEESLQNKCDVIIMDELGRFEQHTLIYLEKVYQVLDSNLCVLGVLKKEDLGYMEEIKTRIDTQVFDLDEKNPSNILELITDNLKEIYHGKK